jgi:hypothetical protein
MGAGKIVLLIFGVIIVLISFGLIAGGGILFWADAKYIDNEGFLTSDTLHIERDSHAVVAGPIEIDEVALDVLRTLGVITIFEFEGMNNNPSKPIFMGVVDVSDMKSYLNNVDYDEITSIDFGWHLDFDKVTYINHPGTSMPPPPTSETIWTASADGTATETLVWETEVGSYSLVVMNGDGSGGIDLEVAFKAKIPSIVGWGVGFLVVGIVLLGIGGLMIFLAVRRTQVHNVEDSASQ